MFPFGFFTTAEWIFTEQRAVPRLIVRGDCLKPVAGNATRPPHSIGHVHLPRGECGGRGLLQRCRTQGQMWVRYTKLDESIQLTLAGCVYLRSFRITKCPFQSNSGKASHLTPGLLTDIHFSRMLLANLLSAPWEAGSHSLSFFYPILWGMKCPPPSLISATKSCDTCAAPQMTYTPESVTVATSPEWFYFM